VYLCMLILKMR